jgi:hypothetical protein
MGKKNLLNKYKKNNKKEEKEDLMDDETLRTTGKEEDNFNIINEINETYVIIHKVNKYILKTFSLIAIYIQIEKALLHYWHHMNLAQMNKK